MKEKTTLIFVVCGMTILAGRLRAGHKEGDPASEFFKGDDRNMTGGLRRVLNAPCNRRWGERYSLLDRDRAESRGYLTAVPTGDGMIHLLSSRTYYAFNLAWLKAERPPPTQNENGSKAS